MYVNTENQTLYSARSLKDTYISTQRSRRWQRPFYSIHSTYIHTLWTKCIVQVTQNEHVYLSSHDATTDHSTCDAQTILQQDKRVRLLCVRSAVLHTYLRPETLSRLHSSRYLLREKAMTDFLRFVKVTIHTRTDDTSRWSLPSARLFGKWCIRVGSTK